jgi:hypothetical protein
LLILLAFFALFAFRPPLTGIYREGALSHVIAGLDPAIHRFDEEDFFRWMRGSSPRMTD